MMIQFTMVGGVGGVKKKDTARNFFFDVSVHGPAATIIHVFYFIFDTV